MKKFDRVYIQPGDLKRLRFLAKLNRRPLSLQLKYMISHQLRVMGYNAENLTPFTEPVEWTDQEHDLKKTIGA
jgi:hypothetical protein